jgi:hypothetical protein
MEKYDRWLSSGCLYQTDRSTKLCPNARMKGWKICKKCHKKISVWDLDGWKERIVEEEMSIGKEKRVEKEKIVGEEEDDGDAEDGRDEDDRYNEGDGYDEDKGCDGNDGDDGEGEHIPLLMRRDLFAHDGESSDGDTTEETFASEEEKEKKVC